MNYSKLTMSAALCAVLILSCGEDVKPPEILRPVRFEQVFESGGERVRSFSGVAQSGLESRLSFRVSGTIRKIAVQVGDQVTAGELIAELDPADYQLQLQQAQASLESALAQERKAEADYRRFRQLYENRSASKNDLDAARAASESANAQVQASRKQIEQLRRQLNYTRLLAPNDGAIASIDREVNENVSAGQTVIQLTAGAEMEVQVAIPEILISQIREGDPVTVTFTALGDKKCEARITEVGVSSTGFATTFPVIVRLTEDQEGIRSGMAAEVTFTFSASNQRSRIVVPSFSVAEDRDGRFVYIVEPGDQEGLGVVKRRNVEIGELTENGIEILEGLADGDRVVTAGVSKLTSDMNVKFVPAGR